ncbi:MAG: PilN domain-containing protein [Halanaerobiales bacterium]|nr:PilN domain-containing protein [Halanaerobiales bacterium]
MLNPKKEEFLNLRSQVSQLEREVEQYQGRYIWAYITQETGFVIPENVQLNSFSISNDILQVSGNANTTDLLINYINNMNQSPYFNNVTLQSYDKQDQDNF